MNGTQAADGTQTTDAGRPADDAAAADRTSTAAGTGTGTGGGHGGDTGGAAGPATDVGTKTGTQAGEESGKEQGAETGTGTEAPHDRIDELDARLIALVRERRSVSERVEQARIDSGGGRVHLAGEMRVLDHYRRELGRPGTQLAMTLLRLCRGQL